MNGLEITVMLGTAVFAGAVLAPRLRIAAPLFLLVVELVLGFVPELREIELPPQTVLLLFLPVMLFWESLTTSLRSVRRDFRGIVIMSTVLVVATAFAVAGIAHALGMPWAAALILGAAVAPRPPDQSTEATCRADFRRRLSHRRRRDRLVPGPDQLGPAPADEGTGHRRRSRTVVLRYPPHLRALRRPRQPAGQRLPQGCHSPAGPRRALRRRPTFRPRAVSAASALRDTIAVFDPLPTAGFRPTLGS